MSKTRNSFASSHACFSHSLSKSGLKASIPSSSSHTSHFSPHHLFLEMITVMRKTKLNEMSVIGNPHYDKPPMMHLEMFFKVLDQLKN